MKSLKGVPIVESGCLDPKLNIFYSRAEDGRLYVMRQPRRVDIKKHREAWKRVSAENRFRFKRKVHPPWLYSISRRCKQKLYAGEVPGMMPLIVEVDNEVVAFADAAFMYGRDTWDAYSLPPDDLCSNCSITTLDDLQGMGIGTYYATTSNTLSRHFGCQWIFGETFMNGGLWHIRQRDGWETLGTHQQFVLHRKRL